MATPSARRPRPPRPSRKARFTAARLAAAQLLYQTEFTGGSARAREDEALAILAAEKDDLPDLVSADRDLLLRIIRGVAETRGDIDAVISACLPAHRSLEGLDVLIACILRAGVWELINQPDVAQGIIVNDYVDVTHGFFESREPSLVNALLDAAGHMVRDPDGDGDGDDAEAVEPDADTGPDGDGGGDA